MLLLEFQINLPSSAPSMVNCVMGSAVEFREFGRVGIKHAVWFFVRSRIGCNRTIERLRNGFAAKPPGVQTRQTIRRDQVV